MPPECLRTLGLTEVNNQATADIVSGEKWDVYSLAVLFSFIFTERHPFADLRNNQIVRRVVRQGLRPDLQGIMPSMPGGMESLIQRMWATNAWPSVASLSPVARWRKAS